MIPVIPILKKLLVEYRAKTKGRPDDYIFRGERRGAPLNLANLAARVIKPALETCIKCQKVRLNHKEESHAFEWDEIQRWRGWHAFRRGLAANLYSLGVQPKVIAAILRHSDIGTTLSYYVQTPDDESRKALEKVEDLVIGFCWLARGSIGE